jgi:hypothetical protein
MLRLIAAALAAALFTASAPQPAVDAEYQRLDATLKSLAAASLPKDLEPEMQGARDALNRVAHAEGAEYRLYRLRDAFVTVERLRYFVDHNSATKSADAFRSLWSKERPRFEKLGVDQRGTVLERALAQSAATRAERLFEASAAYAKATTPSNGVYYIADASANLGFRDFVRHMATESNEKIASASGIASSLDALETATLQFFSTREAAPDAIPVSVRMKEARELLADRRLEGAMLLAIEADIVLTDRGGPEVLTSTTASPRAGSMASLLTEWAANEQQPDRKKSREKAMTFYAGLFAPAAKSVASSKPAVTVTLVRWPYT